MQHSPAHQIPSEAPSGTIFLRKSKVNYYSEWPESQSDVTHLIQRHESQWVSKLGQQKGMGQKVKENTQEAPLEEKRPMKEQTDNSKQQFSNKLITKGGFHSI